MRMEFRIFSFLFFPVVTNTLMLAIKKNASFLQSGSREARCRPGAFALTATSRLEGCAWLELSTHSKNLAKKIRRHDHNASDARMTERPLRAHDQSLRNLGVLCASEKTRVRIKYGLVARGLRELNGWFLSFFFCVAFSLRPVSVIGSSLSGVRPALRCVALR